MPPSDLPTGGAVARPPRSDVTTEPDPTVGGPGDPAYQQWLADQSAKPADQSPADADPEYQAYLADKAEQDRAAQMALLDPEYAKWKAAQQAEADRIAALGPTCPHCHAPLDNPSREQLPYCWACGFGAAQDQAARYAEAVDAAASS